MFRLALRTLRRRKGGFIASLVVLFFGALIVMACGGLMETGIRLTTPPKRLAGAPLIVTGSQAYTERVRLPNSLVSKLAQTNGVERAVPDLSFSAALLQNNEPLNDATELPGHDWSTAQLAPYQLVNGTAPMEASDVVIDQQLAAKAGTAVGNQVTVVASGNILRFQVSGIVDDPAGTGAALFFTDSEAQTLSGHPNQVDSIGVVPTSGTDISQLQTRITQVIRSDNAEVLTGNRRGLAEFPTVAQDGDTLIAIAGVFGGIAIMVAIFIVSSTLSLSVQQRRREMALLRAIGATPRQLRRMVVSETLFVAVIGTALAYAPSAHFGTWLLGRFSSNGAVSSALVYRQGWVPSFAGVLIALLTALVAALVAARGATHARPTEALAEATIQKKWLGAWRLIFAMLCLAGGSALALVTALAIHGPIASSTAGPAAMLWAAGLALLGPGIAGLMTLLLQWPFRLFGGLTGKLATLNLRLRKVRIAGVVTPIMLATGLATALLYLQTSQSAQATHVYTSTVRADAILASSTGGLAPSTVQAVAAQPGVQGASAFLTSSGYVNTPNADPQDQQSTEPFVGITAGNGLAATNFTVTSGDLNNLTGNTLALPEGQAAGLNKKVGDMVTLRFGDGAEQQLKLVALFSIPAGYESVLLPANLLLQHTTTGLIPQILVRSVPGTSPTQFAQTLHTFAAQYPGMQLSINGSASGPSQEQTGAWVNYLLVGMIIAYTVIALLNTVIVSTTERQREFALQQLIGATRGQVLRMMGAEALLVSIAGAILGTFVGVVTLVPFCLGLKSSPWPSGPLWMYGVIIGSAAVLTLLTTFIVSIVVLRARPVDIAASRE